MPVTPLGPRVASISVPTPGPRKRVREDEAISDSDSLDEQTSKLARSTPPTQLSSPAAPLPAFGHNTAPPPTKRTRLLPPLMPADTPPIVVEAAKLRALAKVIDINTRKPADTSLRALKALSEDLEHFAHLAHLDVAGCASSYQRSLLYLREVGGTKDPFDAISRLHRHLYNASLSPSALTSFCRVAAEWLPSADASVVRTLVGTLQVLAQHPHPHIAQLAHDVHQRFIKYGIVKLQVERENMDFDALEATLTNQYKLRDTGHRGEQVDLNHDRNQEVLELLANTLLLPKAVREGANEIWDRVLGVSAAEDAAYDGAGMLGENIIDETLEAATENRQFLRLTVGKGTDDGHAFGLSIEVEDNDTVNLSLINTGYAADYFHELLYDAYKPEVQQRKEGHWIRSQYMDDCVNRVNRIMERMIVAPEIEREVRSLRRLVFAYVYDKQSDDRTLTRKIGKVESRSVMPRGNAEPRDYVNAEFRIEGIPRDLARQKLRHIVDVAGNYDLCVDDALSAIYATLGAAPSDAGPLFDIAARAHVEQALIAEGLARLTGFPSNKQLHLTTRFLDAGFNAETAADSIVERMRAQGQAPAARDALVETLKTLRSYAEFEGALRTTLTPEQYTSPSEDAAEQRP